jgi:hypothetical protein
MFHDTGSWKTSHQRAQRNRKEKKEETRRRMMRHRQRKGGIRNVHSEGSEQEMGEEELREEI